MLQFTRAIRKSASSMLSVLCSSFLLIKGRSLHGFLWTDSHASMESVHKKP